MAGPDLYPSNTGLSGSLPSPHDELDLTESALRAWVRQAAIGAGRGPVGALTTEEREELGRLRREVRTLRMERDILKKRSWAGAAHPAA